VKWHELLLSEHNAASWSSQGKQAYAFRACRRSGHLADLEVGIADREPLVLADATDDGETTPVPRVLLLTGETTDLRTFGGPTSYLVSLSSREVLDTTTTWRAWETAEYWSTEILTDASGFVVVYESGVLSMDPTLRIRWHVKKGFDDIFKGSRDGRLEFLNNESTWHVVRATGMIV
jgi:hypothetical protein